MTPAHRPAKEFLILILHRHDNQFSATPRVVEDLAEGEPIRFEVVRVTGCGGIRVDS